MIASNIDEGDVLILSAGSMRYTGPHPVAPAIADAGACADACGNLPGCNAWTFCSSQHGCGTGCKAWSAKYPKRECLFNAVCEAKTAGPQHAYVCLLTGSPAPTPPNT